MAVALAAAGWGWGVDTERFLLGLAAFVGVSVAASAPWPRWLGCGLAAAAGIGIGLGSRPEDAQSWAMVATLLGVGLGASAWLVNVVLLVEQMKRPWLQVLVRVVGSWATASCVLVLALWFAQRQAPERNAEPSAHLQRFDLRR